MAILRFARTSFFVALALAFQAAAGFAAMPGNPDAVAVVIGNRDYRGDRVPKVEYARRDADAMRDYLIRVLGYREGNIIDLRDATQAEMTAAFGNERSYQGKLWQYVRPGESDVTVYYSGHGVPGLKDRRGYLLPVDADPERPEINGYPLDLLYSNLEKLKAHSVTVYLDACFSGDSGGGMLIRGASGVTVVPKLPAPAHDMAVITAARGNEVASWDEETRHGLFTSYLLKALNGLADDAKYGNGDGRVTLAEVRTYLDREMTYAARRRYGRIQQASLAGPDDALLGLVPTVSMHAASPAQAAPVAPSTPPASRADPTVHEAQAALAALGYDPGPADGLMGDRTRAAVEKFQRDNGLTVDGTVTDVLLAALTVASRQVAAVTPGPAPSAPPPVVQSPTAAWGATFRDCVGSSGLMMASAGTELPSGASFCGPEMVVVSAGSFDMGDLSGDGGDNQQPVHRVTIPHPFAIGVYEVTQAEWTALMGSNPSDYKGERKPVENVSWNDAQEFLKRLSAKTGKHYRLPSEAEWEYAARAGSRTKYPWGDYIDPSLARYGERGGASPVGSYKPNAFGLFDTVGNVWEWVADCYNKSYRGAPTDGRVWTAGNCSERVVRGGCWLYAWGEDSAYRSSVDVGNRNGWEGFRVARTF